MKWFPKHTHTEVNGVQRIHFSSVFVWCLQPIFYLDKYEGTAFAVPFSLSIKSVSNLNFRILHKSKVFCKASLREGGGFCEAKDGRSLRKYRIFIKIYIHALSLSQLRWQLPPGGSLFIFAFLHSFFDRLKTEERLLLCIILYSYLPPFSNASEMMARTLL